MVTAQSTILAPLISQAFLDELILQNRTNTMTVDNRLILNNCKGILIIISGNGKKGDDLNKVLNHVSYMLEKYIDKYPTYEASAEYALRIAPKYVNQAADKAFFFGM